MNNSLIPEEIVMSFDDDQNIDLSFDDDQNILLGFEDSSLGGDYPPLRNKPKINEVTLIGNKTTYGNADFTYLNGCVAYSTVADNVNEPNASKYGRVVNLSGAFKNPEARPDTAAFDIGKVPTGCEPLKTQYILNQGTTQYKFLLTIRTDGTINVSRYSATATNTAVPANAWLNINATYISAS